MTVTITPQSKEDGQKMLRWVSMVDGAPVILYNETLKKKVAGYMYHKTSKSSMGTWWVKHHDKDILKPHEVELAFSGEGSWKPILCVNDYDFLKYTNENSSHLLKGMRAW